MDVQDLAAHHERLRTGDGYRLAACPRCGGKRLHVHDHLHRVLAGEPHVARIEIVRYICADAECGATWRVLPAFVARHLWRRWATVARTIAGRTAIATDLVPGRTRRRWNARMKSAARQLVHVLAHHDDEAVVRFVQIAGFDATRRELVELLTAGRVLGIHALADIAATVHALQPGIRLM